MEILDESTIQELMQTCYSKLPTQEPGSLCLLYLLFAAGSVTLAEYPDSASMLSDSLRQADEYFDFAEATLIRIGGYEKFEVWMIQAWALMTTYSLAASKWNAADAYIGESSCVPNTHHKLTRVRIGGTGCRCARHQPCARVVAACSN